MEQDNDALVEKADELQTRQVEYQQIQKQSLRQTKKKSKRRRFRRSSYSPDKSVSTKSDSKKHSSEFPINKVVYEPLLYSEPPVPNVKYASDGSLDTFLNRIDFKKDNWYSQFQYFRELLGEIPSLNATELEEWPELYSLVSHSI